MGSEAKAAGGLFVRGSTGRIPLLGVSIDITGHGCSAHVRVQQRYANTESVPIEAVYSFPLEEQSAIHELVVEIGDRRLVGRIEERDRAFDRYDQALAEGHAAILADQDRPNIFTISVGNLLPGQEATVTLSYATELEQHEQDVRIMIPTTVSPRYVPAATAQSMDPAELERLNPPRHDGRLTYGLSLAVRYTSPLGLNAVTCPSHPARIVVDGDTVVAELVGSNVQLDRDFVLAITLQRPFEPAALVTRDGDDAYAVLVHFCPRIEATARQAREFVFLIDRSGSMAGESIAQARDALQLALRSLEAGDSFNVIGFGSRFEMLFPESRAYDQAALDDATAAVKSWDADLGGTELLGPLQAVLIAAPVAGLRHLMLLTDGQVGNEAECVALAAAHAATTRIFTFGVGYGASEYLVRGLARVCGGKAEFIHPNERIEPVVLRQLRRAAAVRLENVRIAWGGLRPDLITPHNLTSVFDGERLTVYARIPATAPSEMYEATLLADLPGETVRWTLPLDLRDVGNEPAVPLLMARSAIRDLEEGTEHSVRGGSNQRARADLVAKGKVLALALRYGLMSSQTSFVAVEERAETAENARPELRRVPIALTHGWGAFDEDLLVRPAFLRGYAPADACESARGFFGPDSDVDIPQLAAPARALGLRQSPRLLARFGGNDRKGWHERWSGESRDSFMEIIASQRADGSFELSNSTLKALGIPAKAMKAAIKSLGNPNSARAIAHTAVALFMLETRFNDHKDRWEMLAEKARRWLDSQTTLVPTGATSWTEWVQNIAGSR